MELLISFFTPFGMPLLMVMPFVVVQRGVADVKENKRVLVTAIGFTCILVNIPVSSFAW